MRRSINYYKNRVSILSTRDEVMNKHIIAKLNRIIHKMENQGK